MNPQSKAAGLTSFMAAPTLRILEPPAETTPVNYTESRITP
jgi:hypothetical protein